MGRSGDTGRKITICAAPGRNGAKSIFSIAHPPAAVESARQFKHVLELMVAAGRKPSPQSAVAPERFADRSQLRLVGFNCCGEDVFEAVIVNPGEVLTQDRGGNFICPQKCRTYHSTGLAKKDELGFAVLRWTKPVDLVCDSR